MASSTDQASLRPGTPAARRRAARKIVERAERVARERAPVLVPLAEPAYFAFPGHGVRRLVETREDWERLVQQGEARQGARP